MEIILEIKNKNPKPLRFDILLGLFTYDKKNCGLPKGVEINVVRITEIEKEYPYHEFLQEVICNPIIAKVSSDDNRRLIFFKMNAAGDSVPCVPQLTQAGEKRGDDDIWDYLEYNIADTHEPFIIDGSEIISVSTNAASEFKITFEVLTNIRLTTPSPFNHNNPNTRGNRNL